MSNTSQQELEQRIKDITDWNEGTVYKGYDNEELVDTLTEDTAKGIKDLIASLREQLLAGIGEDEPYDKYVTNAANARFRALVEEVMGDTN